MNSISRSGQATRAVRASMPSISPAFSRCCARLRMCTFLSLTTIRAPMFTSTNSKPHPMSGDSKWKVFLMPMLNRRSTLPNDLRRTRKSRRNSSQTKLIDLGREIRSRHCSRIRWNCRKNLDPSPPTEPKSNWILFSRNASRSTFL